MINDYIERELVNKIGRFRLEKRKLASENQMKSVLYVTIARIRIHKTWRHKDTN